MITNNRQYFPKTCMKLLLIPVLLQTLSAQSTTLLDNKPLVSIQNVDSIENEIDSRSGRALNMSSQDSKPLNSVFDDLYEKCLANLSFPCLQRKMLVYMNKVDRVKGVNIFSDYVSVVRTSDDHTPEITEQDLEQKLSPAEEQTQLENLMEHQVDKFMDNHVIRLKLPEGITAGLSNSLKGRSYSIAGNALDISMARMFTIVEGRGKGGGGGGGGGKMKGMKKMMGMMMMGVMGKMVMLLPMMMMMLKMKAMKALLIAKLALALSLLQLIKMMMSGGGKGKMGGGGSKEVIIVHDNHGDSGSGGSGGWSSGGGSGGGWSSGGSSGGHSSGGGGGWSSGGGGHGGDSYSSGPHSGGGDATYSGGDAGGGWASGGSGGGGWGKRSWDAATNTAHTTWPMYRAHQPYAATEEK